MRRQQVTPVPRVPAAPKGRAPRLRRILLTGVGLAIPLVLIVDGGALAAHRTVRHTTVSPPAIVRTVTPVQITVPASVIPPRAPGAPPNAVAAVARGAALVVYTAPGGPVRMTMPNPDPATFNAPVVLLINGAQPGWYRVLLPIRPNDTTGWVKAGDISVRAVPYQITIVQHLHTATLWRDGVKVWAFPVAIGKAQTPSPDGLFFIEAIIDNIGGDTAYGPWALALSGYSNVLKTFGVGDAEIAMHGTDEDSSVGTTASHGCFRMHNTEVTRLAHTVTLGTPVYVTA